eukprot:TRINITY_DN7124_c1_g1_i3.p1 TRINITY_DN7124_c1_g1~~TRINITY_DN7124_c1_g1_i3.p1  ORF type:complete len:752 (-),score=87.87 TRINITY_DN7124_c1_g1_i3:302-2557(-)
MDQNEWKFFISGFVFCYFIEKNKTFNNLGFSCVNNNTSNNQTKNKVNNSNYNNKNKATQFPSLSNSEINSSMETVGENEEMHRESSLKEEEENRRQKRNSEVCGVDVGDENARTTNPDQRIEEEEEQVVGTNRIFEDQVGRRDDQNLQATLPENCVDEQLAEQFLQNQTDRISNQQGEKIQTNDQLLQENQETINGLKKTDEEIQQGQPSHYNQSQDELLSSFRFYNTNSELVSEGTIVQNINYVSQEKLRDFSSRQKHFSKFKNLSLLQGVRTTPSYASNPEKQNEEEDLFALLLRDVRRTQSIPSGSRDSPEQSISLRLPNAEEEGTNNEEAQSMPPFKIVTVSQIVQKQQDGIYNVVVQPSQKRQCTYALSQQALKRRQRMCGKYESQHTSPISTRSKKQSDIRNYEPIEQNSLTQDGQQAYFEKGPIIYGQQASSSRNVYRTKSKVLSRRRIDCSSRNNPIELSQTVLPQHPTTRSLHGDQSFQNYHKAYIDENYGNFGNQHMNLQTDDGRFSCLLDDKCMDSQRRRARFHIDMQRKNQCIYQKPRSINAIVQKLCEVYKESSVEQNIEKSPMPKFSSRGLKRVGGQTRISPRSQSSKQLKTQVVRSRGQQFQPTVKTNSVGNRMFKKKAGVSRGRVLCYTKKQVEDFFEQPYPYNIAENMQEETLENMRENNQSEVGFRSSSEQQVGLKKRSYRKKAKISPRKSGISKLQESKRRQSLRLLGREPDVDPWREKQRFLRGRLIQIRY